MGVVCNTRPSSVIGRDDLPSKVIRTSPLFSPSCMLIWCIPFYRSRQTAVSGYIEATSSAHPLQTGILQGDGETQSRLWALNLGMRDALQWGEEADVANDELEAVWHEDGSVVHLRADVR